MLEGFLRSASVAKISLKADVRPYTFIFERITNKQYNMAKATAHDIGMSAKRFFLTFSLYGRIYISAERSNSVAPKAPRYL
jgi:hypothetical protein